MDRKITGVIAMITVGAFLFSPSWSSVTVRAQSESEQTPRIGENAKRQIAAILADKKQRLAQRNARGRAIASDKLTFSLRSAIAESRGESVVPNAPPLAYRAERSEQGDVALNITAEVTKNLLGTIERNGGQVLFASPEYRFVQAYLPLEAVEAVAGLGEVKRIEFSRKAEVNPPDFGKPEKESWLSKLASGRMLDSSAILSGAVVSQGDSAHRANLARSTFGVTGAGVKIGEMSDSVRFLEQTQAAGELPNVTVIPGQSGVLASGSDTGEGTAKLEIIHDLAPGAQLYFATGTPNGLQNPVAFAQNIRALRDAGCNIIIDDIRATLGPDGTPFQEAIVASAINDVTASGVLFVTSAGNEGNKSDGTSGTWEGDFTPSGAPLTVDGVEYGETHDFYTGDTGATNNSTTSIGPGAYVLWWADSFGGATVDYDLFVLNADGSQLIGASADTQDGESSDYPFESLGSTSPVGSQIVVLRYDTAPPRALYFSYVDATILFNTDGTIHGHKGAANALSIAATPSGYATRLSGPQGPFPGAFNRSNQIERFSTDGPRRIFYNANNTPITPGNFLFSTNGGRLVQKVDFTGADGVSTTSPSAPLRVFFGTSAAAPHIAAIAALVKSANPRLTRAQMTQILMQSAIDIEAPGFDRDSGWGIVDAFRAVQLAGQYPRQ